MSGFGQMGECEAAYGEDIHKPLSGFEQLVNSPRFRMPHRYRMSSRPENGAWEGSVVQAANSNVPSAPDFGLLVESGAPDSGRYVSTSLLGTWGLRVLGKAKLGRSMNVTLE